MNNNSITYEELTKIGMPNEKIANFNFVVEDVLREALKEVSYKLDKILYFERMGFLEEYNQKVANGEYEGIFGDPMQE